MTLTRAKLTPAAALAGSRIAASSFAAALAAIVVGCGASSVDDTASSRPDRPFPDPRGRTLEQILASAGVADDIVASPAGRVYRPGRNRFGFGVFTVEREQIDDAEVAVYVAHGPDGQARGPFPVRREELSTAPAFEAETTAADPDSASVLYVSQLELPAPGEWRLVALLREEDGFAATRMPSIEVGSYESVPAPGEDAPRVHTPTAADVGAISEIDTRVPPDTMHEVDLADALGREPVVLLFATPALCESRMCGPVVDVAEEVKSGYEDVSFIHMEVYKENDPNKGIRPQLKAYGLPTEPWLFVIDERGVVSSAIEGGFSARELERALEQVLGAQGGS